APNRARRRPRPAAVVGRVGRWLMPGSALVAFLVGAALAFAALALVPGLVGTAAAFFGLVGAALALAALAFAALAVVPGLVGAAAAFFGLVGAALALAAPPLLPRAGLAPGAASALAGA